MSESVLIVEDEEAFIEALTVGLEREGFVLHVARDGLAALAMFDEVRPDLVLLDVMLPKLSGVDVCREIRTRSTVPIIMVTARSEEIDIVVALEVGADDYVTKPYRLRELVARIRANMRRAPERIEARANRDDAAIEIEGVRIDVDRHEVSVNGDDKKLPLKEFELLAFLMDNAGRVLTRDQIIDQVWGSDYVGDTKTLDVHIKRLRERIETDRSVPQRIVTIRGLGYKYQR